MESNIRALKDSRSELEKARDRIDYLEGLVKESGLETLAEVKKENIQLKTDKAVLEERIKQIGERFNTEVKNAVNEKVKDIKVQAETLRKENSGLRSGLAGTKGKITAAQERENVQYSKVEKVSKENDVLKGLLDSVNNALANTKELLVRSEADKLILLENNKMLKDQVEMLLSHKELLEKLLKHSESIEGKVDSINVDSINEVGKVPAVPGLKSLFDSKDDANYKISIMIEAAICMIEKGKKCDINVARKFNLRDANFVESKIKKHRNNGVYDIIEAFVRNDYTVSEELRQRCLDNTEYDYSSLLEILDTKEYSSYKVD